MDNLNKTVTGEFVNLLDETYYHIQNYDAMPPFFMTIVSSDDHWLFISTTGGLTAGRINADHALFPYYTVDRVTENADNTGAKTVLHIHKQEQTYLWEPFTDRIRTPYTIERSLYKNITGSSLIFEEVNKDFNLIFRYAWRTSTRYGIVKTGWLINEGDEPLSVTVTDGLQNILPAFVPSGTQNEFSVLLNAYKRNELDADTGLGLFSLSSRLTDLAEPSEALRANTIWQVGLDSPVHLLSTLQLDKVRMGQTIHAETDIRGQRGAYFVQARVDLEPDGEQTWHLVAEVDQDGAAVANLRQTLASTDNLYTVVEQDILTSSQRLREIIAGADGLQVSGDPLSTEHHFANVLYNVMRGGTFADQYNVDKADLLDYVQTHDHHLVDRHATFFADLPDNFTIQTLKEHADQQDDVDLIRLCYTYLPLTFSRRHGDPSRPWNRFSIYLKNADGTPKLNYEGNWRDIFQNWEALLFSYPEFVEGIIAVFLNATTIDGYNPYRVTRDGIDWEVPEPSNPWANIGYWSDHQIIYLQKLLETCDQIYPDRLGDLLTRPMFSYANVPYRIKPYDDLIRDSYKTIDFDWDAERTIESRVEERGTDGKLILDKQGQVAHVTLAEKLVNLLLAKLVNFVPEGGIWMNTQRPEWNDANNALVGKGISVVTTNYLRRFVVYFQQMLVGAPDELTLSQEVYRLLTAIQQILTGYLTPDVQMDDQQRREIMDKLGQAGSDYRWQCYQEGLSGEVATIKNDDLTAFLQQVQQALDSTIRANRREDDLYHAYNTLQLGDNSATVNYLYPMLEGQVAVLSSGLLEPDEALTLLQQLRQSPLYRQDQHSYILYPDRELPGFLKKNTLQASQVEHLKLVQALIDRKDPRLMVKDNNGNYHFGGEIRNARELQAILDTLAKQPDLADLVEAESAEIHELFEANFHHDQFTGRSGSFFAYEGLGSIYWHMVSKLLLAVQENIYKADAIQSDTLAGLIDAYYDVRAGLGFNKSPEVYGAFPLDPYSHTPRDQGAKQPGMTGMVKEEILTRLGELGIVIDDGDITFHPIMLREAEWLDTPSTLIYWDVDGTEQHLDVPAESYAFTVCQVPFVVQKADQNQLIAQLQDGSQQVFTTNRLDTETSQHIFSRDGVVRQVIIHTTGTIG